jgi:hypothetical protein
MAILAIFTAQLTKSDYDMLRKEVNWEGNYAPGGVFHAAGFDANGGIHVADVWESQEDLDAFVAQRLVPVFQKHKLPPPHVDVYPAHNVNAYSSIDKYKV